MNIKRHATALWEGDLKTGHGALTTPQSGLLTNTPYSFNTRLGDEKGTNPEELIAAAHAGCFTMNLTAKLTAAGFTATQIQTRADLDLSTEGSPTISAIRLSTQATVPGIDAVRFRQIAQEAEQTCPVSRALSAVPITLDAELLG